MANRREQKDKVYCKACKHFLDGWGYLGMEEDCTHPNNIIQFSKPDAVYSKRKKKYEEINKHNNCSWYEETEQEASNASK